MAAELGEVAVAATVSPLVALVRKGDEAVPMLYGLVKETFWPMMAPAAVTVTGGSTWRDRFTG